MAEKVNRSKKRRKRKRVKLTPEEKALEKITGRGTVIEGQRPVRTLKEIIEGPGLLSSLRDKGGLPSPAFLLPPQTKQNTLSTTNPLANFLDDKVSLNNIGREKVISTLVDRILKDFTLDQIVDMRRLVGDVDKDFKNDMSFLTETHGRRLTKEGIKHFFADSLARDAIGTDLYGEAL